MRIFLLFILIAFPPLLSIGQLLNNYDTCRTQTYYQYIGNTTKENYIEKSRTVQDNGIINAGYIKQGGDQDALIIKQNTFGQVIWQKEYGNTNYDEQFTDWRELPNRQLLLGGITKNRTTSQSVFFMMLLSADGNIIWQKSYADMAASSNITNAKIYPDYFGEYFFAAETDSSIIYGMTNNVGNVNWQRSINTNPGTKIVAAISFNSRLLIATNAMDSGYKVSNFYYVDYYWTGNPKNIKYTTKLGGVHQNSNYILHDVEQYGQYTYFSGIRSLGNLPFELIRVNINQGYLREALESFVTPGVTIDSLSRSAINIYGDAISFTAGRKSDRLNSVQLTGSVNSSSNVIWSTSYNLPDSIVLKGNVKTWDNGYIFYGFKELPGGNKKIIQLKTDSASVAASCISRQGKNFSVVRNLFPTDTVRYNYNSLHGLVNFIYNASESNGIIDSLTLCREVKCPQLPLSDSCFNSYQKLYVAYESNSFSTGIQVINGRTFVSGSVKPMDYVQEQQSSFITEMNKNGQVVNQKKYVIGIGSGTHMFKAQDSSLLLYGFTSDSSYYPSILLAKIDTNLNVIWMKSLRITTTPQYSGNLRIGDVKQGSDGSYFIEYSDGITFGETVVYLTKLDINGNFLWSKIYRASYPGINVISVRKLEVSGGNVYMMCVNTYNSYAASIVLKVTESNGTLLWCKKYSNVDDYLDLSGMINMYNNELVFGGIVKNNNTDNRNILLKVTSDGNIISGVSYMNMNTNTAPLMNFMHNANGNIYMSSVFYNSPPFSNPSQINVTVNSNLNIISSKKRYSAVNYYGGIIQAIGAGGQLYETGAYPSGYDYYSQLYLIKFSPDGSVGTCPSDTMVLDAVAAPAISVTNITCVQSDSFFTIRTPVYRSDQFFLATSKLICASVPGCNFLDVTGIESICDNSVPYTFHAVRNNGCSAPLQWIYDNSNIQLINQTDSSITLRFLATGSKLLKARFTSNCTAYIDSLLIHIIGNAPKLNIGADTILCPGISLLLNAKRGFRSYLWQDGSSDSTFTVNTAGLYFVTVADSCGNFFTDSIRVRIKNNGPILNLGQDSSFCNTDTIQLNAHRGFLSYLWQDGSTDSVFTVSTPGLYYVTVADSCGNNFSDSVKVKSYRKATTLNLGADTTFCNTVVKQLKAGASFKNYLWQDGSIDSTFTALNTGLFYVKVTDSCGTIFTDSIRIFSDNEVIVFDIGPNTYVCKTDTLLLQVNASLTNYAWGPLVNTIPQGPAAIKVFPNSSTWYHVSAKKQNGCIIRDSIFVDVHIPPTINLGPDKNICAGDTIQLNVGSGFNNYTWSTGEHTASIRVYQVGQYYVSATDNNNCTSRDSLSVIRLISLPVTQLPNEAAICLGQSKILHAGTGFTSYLWNTGALTESITVPSMGAYWVTVINSFGCKHSDSVRINKEFALPTGFIKYKDTAICNFETITIIPLKNYVSYLWSNGSTASSITIKDAGNYRLKVVDINGCIGSDSFAVATKNCNIGVFFPSSFTPNNDGLNDKYRPKVYGNLNRYEISIYNRYGEKMFESRNITEGWNGDFKGIKQQNGAFVWQCLYQLVGEDVQKRSGSLILIR